VVRPRGRGAAPRRRHFRVAAAAAPGRGGLPAAGHRRPAAVVVPVGEPLRDAGEGGRRGGGRGAGGGRRPGLREGRLRRLLQEDLPLLREVEESLRYVSSPSPLNLPRLINLLIFMLVCLILASLLALRLPSLLLLSCKIESCCHLRFFFLRMSCQ
jgi:hypothetical protein